MSRFARLIAILLLILALVVLAFKINYVVGSIGWPGTGVLIVLVLVIIGIYYFVRSFLVGRYSRILLLIICLVAAFFCPYGYIYGLVDFSLNRTKYEQIVRDLDSGMYNAQMASTEYKKEGTLIGLGNDHIARLYKDSLLTMVLFFKNAPDENFCGDLYISDPRRIRDPKLSMIMSEFDAGQLSRNWFWIQTYTDTTQFPK
jgi:hypothetical protein